MPLLPLMAVESFGLLKSFLSLMTLIVVLLLSLLTVNDVDCCIVIVITDVIIVNNVISARGLYYRVGYIL